GADREPRVARIDQAPDGDSADGAVDDRRNGFRIGRNRFRLPTERGCQAARRLKWRRNRGAIVVALEDSAVVQHFERQREGADAPIVAILEGFASVEPSREVYQAALWIDVQP